MLWRQDLSFEKLIQKTKILFLSLLCCTVTAQEDVLNFIETLPDDIKEDILNNQQQNITSPIEVENSLQNSISQEYENFGFSFFNMESSTNSPVLDIPLQGDYTISLNDEVELLLIGNNEKLIKARVDLGGNINIPEIGSIQIANITLLEANKKIEKIIESIYRY